MHSDRGVAYRCLVVVTLMPVKIPRSLAAISGIAIVALTFAAGAKLHSVVGTHPTSFTMVAFTCAGVFPAILLLGYSTHGRVEYMPSAFACVTFILNNLIWRYGSASAILPNPSDPHKSRLVESGIFLLSMVLACVLLSWAIRGHSSIRKKLHTKGLIAGSDEPDVAVSPRGLSDPHPGANGNRP